MGLMPCSRPECSNIMCDTYIQSIGYICIECQEEFKVYCEDKLDQISLEGEIKRNLVVFMNSEKNTYTKGNEMSIDEFFNKNS